MLPDSHNYIIGLSKLNYRDNKINYLTQILLKLLNTCSQYQTKKLNYCHTKLPVLKIILLGPKIKLPASQYYIT
jgi:hypothetical protein